MIQSSPAERVEQALLSAEPFPALLALAYQLRDEGMPRGDLYRLYHSFFLRYTAPGTDESLYDAIADTLDFISGRCPPSRALYPPTA